MIEHDYVVWPTLGLFIHVAKNMSEFVIEHNYLVCWCHIRKLCYLLVISSEV